MFEILICSLFNLAKEAADIKIKVKLPPVPNTIPISAVKSANAPNFTVQVPTIQLERVDENMKDAQQAELPSTSDEDDLLNSETDMEVDKNTGEHAYSAEDYIIEEEAEVNTVVYNPTNPLGLNAFNSKSLASAPAATNQIVVTAQVHATNDSTIPLVPIVQPEIPKTYENATQEERDQMVFEHIQKQDREIALLKDTVNKLANEKKSILKQQSETICDMNLLKERLRTAEDAEEVEVIRNRMKELQKKSLLKKINEKNNVKNFEKPPENNSNCDNLKKNSENYNTETTNSATSSSSESDESDVDDRIKFKTIW